jgi:hypothetical protein
MLHGMKAALLTLSVMMVQPSAAFAAEEISPSAPSTVTAPAKIRYNAATQQQSNVHGHAAVRSSKRQQDAGQAQAQQPRQKKAKIGPRPEMW